MATFFLYGRYSLEATSRIAAARTEDALTLISESGGTLRDMYTLLGERDLVLIIDIPTIEDAFRLSIDLSRLTGISFSTTPAMHVKQFDEMMSKSG